MQSWRKHTYLHILAFLPRKEVSRETSLHLFGELLHVFFYEQPFICYYLHGRHSARMYSIEMRKESYVSGLVQRAAQVGQRRHHRHNADRPKHGFLALNRWRICAR